MPKLKKISYNDKISNLSGISSLYTVTNNEANEIKEVVNNIIDSLYDSQISNKIAFKIARIVPPKEEWDRLTVEISTSKNFIDSNVMILGNSESSSTSGFYAFIDGNDGEKFYPISFIADCSIVKDILVDISEYIEEDASQKENYVRYFFSYDDEMIGGYSPLNLLVNDIQPSRIEHGTPLILLTQEEIARAASICERDCAILQDSVLEFEEDPIPSTFLKFDGMSDALSAFSLASIVGDGLIKIGDLPKKNVAVMAGMRNEAKVETTFVYNGVEYSQRRTYVKMKEAIVDPVLQNVFFNDGTNSYELSGSKLFSKELVGNVNSQYRPTLKFADSSVAVSQTQISNSRSSGLTMNALTIASGIEIPISLENDDFIRLDVEGISGVYEDLNDPVSNFKVYAVRRDSSRADVTKDAGLTICCLDSEAITFNKTSSKMSIDSSEIDDGKYTIFASYKGLDDYLQVNVLSPRFKKLIVEDVPSSIVENDSCNYSVSLVNKKNIIMDITNNCSVVCPDYVYVANGTLSARFVKSDKIAQIGFEYTDMNGEMYHEEHFVKIMSNPIEKLVITAKLNGSGDAVKMLTPRNSYVIAVQAIHKDGTAEDVTQKVKLTFPSDVSFKDKLVVIQQSGTKRYELRIAEERAARNLIVNAEYLDEARNSKSYGLESFFVNGYGFSALSITGQDSIIPGSAFYYESLAEYNDGSVIPVSSQWLYNAEIRNFITSGTTPNNSEIMIYPKRTLISRDMVLSAIYAEPGYEEFENDVAVKNIHISGGFMMSLSGSVIASVDGSNTYDVPFVSNDIFVEAMDQSAFKAPKKILNRQINTDLTLTPSVLSTLVGDGTEYQFVTVRNRGTDESFEIPADGFTVDSITINPGRYDFHFYDLLSSLYCEDNDYVDEREIKTVSYYSATSGRLPISSLVKGDLYRFHSCSLSEVINGTEYQVATGVPYSLTWNFKANTNYKISLTPISKKNNSINSFASFAIDKDISAPNIGVPFAIALKNLTLGPGLQILDAVVTYETETGIKYKQNMNYADSIGGESVGNWLWISNDIPLKAKKLVSILIAYAFKEEDGE